MKAFSEHAFSIVCLPCEFESGFVIPTLQPVLTDIYCDSFQHPILVLPKFIVDYSKQLQKLGCKKYFIILDDLAVYRSWTIPNGYTIPKDYLDSFLNNIAIPDNMQIMLFSQFLETFGLSELFKKLFEESYIDYEYALNSKTGVKHSLVEKEIIRRKKFIKTFSYKTRLSVGNTSVATTVRTKSLLLLANYSAQGKLITHLNTSAYISLEGNEELLMGIDTPSFKKIVFGQKYKLAQL